METKRTFIAIDISEDVRRACERHIDSLRRSFPDVRVGWEKPEKLHITLKFLGDTAVTILPALREEIEKVAESYASFELQLASAGVFPSSSRPRILWVGVDDASGSTLKLSNAVESSCEKFGYRGEKREYRPHVTVGRLKDSVGSVELAATHLNTFIEPVRFDVSGIVLYESELLRSGSVYRAICRVSLKGVRGPAS